MYDYSFKITLRNRVTANHNPHHIASDIGFILSQHRYNDTSVQFIEVSSSNKPKAVQVHSDFTDLLKKIQNFYNEAVNCESVMNPDHKTLPSAPYTKAGRDLLKYALDKKLIQKQEKIDPQDYLCINPLHHMSSVGYFMAVYYPHMISDLKEIGYRVAEMAEKERITKMWVASSPAERNDCHQVRLYPLTFLNKHMGDIIARFKR